MDAETSFGSLHIKRAIVHVIPRAMKKDSSPTPIDLSETQCNLSESIRTRLQLRLRETLSNTGRPIVEDQGISSKAPDEIRNFWRGGDSKFVAVSQQLARLLRETQQGSNSAGILMVAECTFESSSAVLLVKIEREDGMRAELTTENGKKTFDMQYFPDLFFTGKGKVYKVGLFVDADEENKLIEGWAADKQSPGKTVARFFLEKYLGCRYRENPDEVTRRFYDRSEEWINKAAISSSAKAKYDTALAAELQSQKKELSLDIFAKEYIDSKHRDMFVGFMVEHGVPRQSFDKSTELIDSRLERRRYSFDSGVVVTAPLSAVGGTVSISSNAEVTTLTVVGVLQEVKGAAMPGRAGKSRTKAGGEE